MSTPSATAQRISFLPFSAATTHRTLDLTDADASLDLAAGAYEAWLDGTSTAFLRIGAAVDVPASGAPEVAGQFVLPAGGAVTFTVGGTATIALHAQVALGTGTLHLMRKPL